MAPTRELVMAELAKIATPSGGNLVRDDLVRALTIESGVVRFVIEAPTADQARTLGAAQTAAEAALRRLEGVSVVQVVLTAHGPAAKPNPAPAEPPSLKVGGHPTPHQGGPARVSGVDRIIAIASGKGGVGKSTVASNLAVALARQGRRVGLLDADIYGHSVPRMMGTSDRPTQVESMILPPIAHDVRVISIAQFTQGNAPVAWRGPMLHRALQQFLADVYWGDLDVLLLDLPPGTGDVAISVAQLLPSAEILVVTTPQAAAAEVAERAGAIALQTRQRIVGVVENMAGLVMPDGTTWDIFGAGGGRQVAERLTRAVGAEVPLLGQVPLDPALVTAGDRGVPLVLSAPESAAGAELRAIADKLMARRRGLAGMSLGLDPAAR